MTPLDLSIKGAIEEFDQGAAVNPIQQAISALESVEWHGAGSCWIADAEKVEAALTSLRSLNKEVEGVELPKFPLHDVAATAPGVVWLNIFGVESDYESGFPEDHEGITWCESEVGDLDVPYVRVDRVAAVAAALGRGAGQTEAFRQQLEIIAVGDSGNPRKDAETVLVEHGVWEASQPTQAEAASVTTSQTVDELIAYAAQEREKDAEWQQWVERGGYDGDQQAEAPSEREALQLAWDKCKAACDPSDGTVSESAAYRGFFAHGYRAALATQQAVQGEPVAFEFYNPTTGHAIVDYSRQTHVGPLTKEMGYEARALGYINPPPAAVKPGDPVPLWQALEALDSLEESSRGDAPYNHFAAGLVRSALEQSATPPAPGQVERINLSTFAWGVTRMGDNPKAVLVSFRSEPTDDDLRALHEALRPASGRTVHANAAQPGQVERDREDVIQLLDEVRQHFTRDDDLPDNLLSRIDAAIRAARSSEGGGNEHSR